MTQMTHPLNTPIIEAAAGGGACEVVDINADFDDGSMGVIVPAMPNANNISSLEATRCWWFDNTDAFTIQDIVIWLETPSGGTYRLFLVEANSTSVFTIKTLLYTSPTITALAATSVTVARKIDMTAKILMPAGRCGIAIQRTDTIPGDDCRAVATLPNAAHVVLPSFMTNQGVTYIVSNTPPAVDDDWSVAANAGNVTFTMGMQVLFTK